MVKSKEKNNNSFSPATDSDSTATDKTLLSLLNDEDDIISSLAMEKILNRENPQQFLLNYGDAESPVLRKRLQQMSVIIQRRQLLDSFITKFNVNTLTIWNAAKIIDQLYDTQSSQTYIDTMMNQLNDSMPRDLKTLREVMQFVQSQDYKPHYAPLMNPSFFLIGDTLEEKEGAPIVIAIIIYHLCELHNISCTFCISGGRLGLTDSLGYVIDVENNYTEHKNVAREMYNPCTITDFTKIYLIQMFTNAISEGDTWDCHFLTRILSKIDHITPNMLPYPFGDGKELIKGKGKTWKN